MFFTLSKLLSFVLSPLNWVLALLILAIFIRTKRKRLIIYSVTLLYLLSNSFLISVVSNWWDYDSISVDEIHEPYDLGLLLSGYTVLQSNLVNYPHLFHYGNNSNRLSQCIELYQMNKIKKIMISGGSGAYWGEKISEASITKEYLLKLGIAEEDILIEPHSRNTIENAQMSKSFLESHPERYQRILLITSGFHMRRSIKSFEKAGLQVTPFSTGNRVSHYTFHPNHLLPHPNNMAEWHNLIKEWAAINVYRIMGYI